MGKKKDKKKNSENEMEFDYYKDDFSHIPYDKPGVTELEEMEFDKLLKPVKRAITLALIAIIAVVTICNSLYFIKDTESAVVTTFGSATLNNDKGPQWKVPYIQKVKKVSMITKGFPIGYVENEDGVITESEDAEMITNDYNFVDADFYISYKVSDPIKYMYASSHPEEILKNIATSCIRSTMSAYVVDSTLTTGKTEIQSNIKQLIVKKLEEEDIGLVLDDILIQDVEPPTAEVSNAFKAVETAKQGKESAINEANKYRNEQLPAAEANVDKIIQDAEATKTARINEANGQVARFNAQYEEYQKYPLITKQRLFYEAMEELLPNMKVIIDNGNGDIEKYYPVESFAEIQTAGTETAEEGK